MRRTEFAPSLVKVLPGIPGAELRNPKSLLLHWYGGYGYNRAPFPKGIVPKTQGKLGVGGSVYHLCLHVLFQVDKPK